MPAPYFIQVRGYHIDAFGHVNNARYLEFLEDARWQLLGDVKDMLKQNAWLLGIVNININYRQPAFLGQTLRFDLEVKRVGNKSITLTQIITLKDSEQIIADADVTFVVIDAKTNKAIPVNEQMLQFFDD